MTAGRLSPQAGFGGVIFFIINAVLNLSLNLLSPGIIPIILKLKWYKTLMKLKRVKKAEKK
jgi:hypothetical protein